MTANRVELCSSSDHDGAEVPATVTVRAENTGVQITLARCAYCAEGAFSKFLRERWDRIVVEAVAS